MLVHRFEADSKLRCHLFVASALSSHSQHLPFTQAQAIVFGPLLGVLDQAIVDSGSVWGWRRQAEKGASLLSLSNRCNQKVRDTLLKQKPRRAKFHHLVHVRVVAMPSTTTILHCEFELARERCARKGSAPWFEELLGEAHARSPNH